MVAPWIVPTFPENVVDMLLMSSVMALSFTAQLEPCLCLAEFDSKPEM